MRTLIASAIALTALAGAAAACPTYSQQGATYTVTGQDLYSPNSYNVTAGGGNNLRNCGFNHTGYVISRPDFTFYTQGMGQYNRLEIEVSRADCDTVLLVNSANGSWFFDDDSNGNLQPAIDLYGQSNIAGRVDVWVGTYGTSYCGAVLEMETWYN